MYKIWSVDSQENYQKFGYQMSDFKAKCIKFDFGWGSAPDPVGELTALPDLLAAFKAVYF